jgi:hypothetical protein
MKSASSLSVHSLFLLPSALACLRLLSPFSYFHAKLRSQLRSRLKVSSLHPSSRSLPCPTSLRSIQTPLPSFLPYLFTVALPCLPRLILLSRLSFPLLSSLCLTLPFFAMARLTWSGFSHVSRLRTARSRGRSRATTTLDDGGPLCNLPSHGIGEGGRRVYYHGAPI